MSIPSEIPAAETNWELCPVCQDSRIMGSQVDIQGTTALQEVGCTACGSWWTEIYHAHERIGIVKNG